MRLIVGGVRGSYPVAQPDFMKYGGETTSLLVEGEDGERILLDAGTGVRMLGERLAADPKARRVLLLMSHYHLDHVVGLPSLGIIYEPEWSIHIAAPAHDEYVVEATMSRVMQRPYWPLQVEDVASRIRFMALDGVASREPLRWGGLEIRWCPLAHPGGCTAYRVDEPATRSAFVFATDTEWPAATPEQRAGLRALCSAPAPASLLLMDAQYTPAEYARFRGWGHSTWRDVDELAREAGAPYVRLIHHDPRKNDDQLDALQAEVVAQHSMVVLARALDEINIRPITA